MVDDFASMREAVSRRYTKLLKEGIELPDLILVDGGIGQVNAAFGVLKDLGILNCDLIGLAKKEEEIWLPKAKTPVKLSVDSGALKLLQHVRDETHRFATGLNQRLRSKDLFFPVLESIDGIGPKRAAVIMETYKSLEKIAAAAVEELSQCCKISLNSARAARASAKLALLNNEKKKKELKAEFSPHKKRNYNSSAAELAAFAAEETPEYDKPLH